AYMVAFVSGECPKPIVCPSSCVATSDRLHRFHPTQPAQPLLNVILPTRMRRKLVPLTVLVSDDEQKPPTARIPLQLDGSVTSLNGSLNMMRLPPSQPANVVDAGSVPPSVNVIEAVGTFVQAANASLIAAREVTGPRPASPRGSMRYEIGTPSSGSN